MPRGVYDRSLSRRNGDSNTNGVGIVTLDEVEAAEGRRRGRPPGSGRGNVNVESDRDHDEGLETYDPTSNGGEYAAATQRPYTMIVEIEGVSAMLFHAWNNEAVAAKGAAAKGSTEKKTDNVDTLHLA
jgi:hypothetical protein